MLPVEKRIRTKAQLKEWLKIEKSLYKTRYPFLEYWLGATEKAILWKHQVFLRYTEYHRNAGHKLRAAYYWFRARRIQIKYLMAIPPNTCEVGLHIMHLGLVRINPDAQIGKNVSLHVNTVLAAKGTSSVSPILEEGVVIGVGSVVVGGVHIAKNVAVGANSVVTKDITEENIAVAGVPAQKVSSHGRLSWKKNN
ncbi:MAG: hypothetical protein J6Y25_00790 [Elusimicrobiaceae bacterium]|nr:hypothetical protein [Elusimicrobiaceae bacterium]MBP5617100.1 hypothetical protein [Elusimicrobiaceae bacterium]